MMSIDNIESKTDTGAQEKHHAQKVSEDLGSTSNLQDAKTSSRSSGRETIKNLFSRKSEDLLSLPSKNEISEEKQVFNLYIAGNYVGDNARITGNIASQSLRGRDLDTSNDNSEDNSLIMVSIEEINKLKSVYMKNLIYENASKILDVNNVLMISGDPNTGKSSASIHLMLSRDEVNKIYWINSEVDLDKFNFNEKRGYIYKGMSYGKISDFLKGGLLLERISQKLKEKSSYLIFSLDSNCYTLSRESSPYTLLWEPTQCSETLLKNHLSWYCTKNATTLKDSSLVQDESILNLLNQRLSLRDIDDLARRLANVITGETELPDALSGFQAVVAKQVEDWFDTHPDLEHRLLMITLSVFSGCRYDQISMCRQKLSDIINKRIEKSSEEKLGLDNLNVKLSDYIKEVRAHLDNTGSKNSHYGIISTDKIIFDNLAFQSAVLLHIWKEYHNYRKALLEWLRELGFHESLEIRNKAAIAVGEIGQYAFSEIEEEVIRTWSTHPDDKVKRLAAFTLSIPASSGLNLPIQRLLHVWSMSGNRHRQYTAIASYNAMVGTLSPDYTLRDLLFIAESNNSDLFDLVIECIIEIFSSGDTLSVLATLRSWSTVSKENRDTTQQMIGVFIFSKLMNLTMSFDDSRHKDPPILLWLSKQDPVYEGLIIDLLRNSLDLRIAQSDMFDNILTWLRSLDKNLESKLFKVMGRIIYRLIKNGTDKEKGRLHKKMNSWIVQDKSTTAERILLSIQGS